MRFWLHGEPERLLLAFSTGLAFLCTLVFTSSLALGCGMLADAARRRGVFGASLGPYLARGLWIMGALWMIQDMLLAEALFGSATEVGAHATYGFALMKFTATGVALAYIAVVGVAVLVRWRRAE